MMSELLVSAVLSDLSGWSSLVFLSYRRPASLWLEWWLLCIAIEKKLLLSESGDRVDRFMYLTTLQP